MTFLTWISLLAEISQSEVKPLQIVSNQKSCSDICKSFLPDGNYTKFKKEMTSMGAQQMSLICDGVNVNTQLGTFRGKNDSDASTTLSQNCSSPVSAASLEFIEKQDWLGSSKEFQAREKKDYTKEKDGNVACGRIAELQQLCAMKGSQLEFHCEQYNFIAGAGSTQSLIAHNATSIALLGTATLACGAACALGNIEPISTTICTGAGIASAIQEFNAQMQVSKSPLASKLRSWEEADKAMAGLTFAGGIAAGATVLGPAVYSKITGAGGAATTTAGNTGASGATNVAGDAGKKATTAQKAARASACFTAITSGALLAFRSVNLEELVNVEKKSCKQVKDIFDPNFKSIQEMHAAGTTAFPTPPAPGATPSTNSNASSGASGTNASSGASSGTNAGGAPSSSTTPTTSAGASGVSFSGTNYDSLKRAAEGVTDPTQKQNILNALETGTFKPGTAVEKALMEQNAKVGKATAGLQGRILDKMQSMSPLAAVASMAPASMQSRLTEMDNMMKDPSNRAAFGTGFSYASSGGARAPSSQETNPLNAFSSQTESLGSSFGAGLTSEVAGQSSNNSLEDQDVYHSNSKYNLFEIVSRRILALTPRVQ
jgi:hypothetical protein